MVITKINMLEVTVVVVGKGPTAAKKTSGEKAEDKVMKPTENIMILVHTLEEDDTIPKPTHRETGADTNQANMDMKKTREENQKEEANIDV